MACRRIGMFMTRWPDHLLVGQLSKSPPADGAAVRLAWCICMMKLLGMVHLHAEAFGQLSKSPPADGAAVRLAWCICMMKLLGMVHLHDEAFGHSQSSALFRSLAAEACTSDIRAAGMDDTWQGRQRAFEPPQHKATGQCGEHIHRGSDSPDIWCTLKGFGGNLGTAIGSQKGV
jgi:hypothetical protein